MPKSVATFWHERTGGVNYYRSVMPAKKLPASLASFKDMANNDRFAKTYENGEVKVKLIDQKGPCAIWSFPGTSERILLMREQQVNGLRVMVEVDDNYTTSAPVLLSEWQDEPSRNSVRPSYKIHRSCLPWADGVICSTPALADVYENFSANVYVCQNSIDPDDWPEPEREPFDPLQKKPLRIGWAASDSHWKDVDLIAPAFKWAARQPNVEIVVMGIHESVFRPLKIPITHFPWTDDLAQYRKNLSYLDIAVCPLHHGEWEDCKSDIKAMEAAMAGALPVVSRVPPFEPWHDRVPTAEDRLDFAKIIQDLVRNREGLRAKAKEAMDYVLRERVIEKSVENWRRAIAG